MTSNARIIHKTSYKYDNRPRHYCQHCGKVVRFNTRMEGLWEIQTCSKCKQERGRYKTR